MKVAFLFSGQGAQSVGMGKDLYNYYSESKTIFNNANDILGWDLKKLCFEDPEDLISQTRYTQPALFVASAAAFVAAKANGIMPNIVAGFSLGEYTALFASGALSFEQALSLVEKRAIYMDQISETVNGTMAAILGLSIEKVDTLCKEQDTGIVEVANDNCPGQVVISGEAKAVERVCEMAKESGAKRALPLNVSGPFHSILLEEAAKQMEDEVKLIQIAEPIIPIISNVEARPINAEEIRKNIPLQIKSRVRFRESIEYLIAQDVDQFVEVGKGKTLCNFVKKTDKSKTVCHIESPETLQKAKELLGGVN
ncbi:MAG TPA: ACP S-malonyltransferase [Epulopiscium sp.]|nr:ACP S-malonyltransferase [Candidatus Epulonipiscium sp.]